MRWQASFREVSKEVQLACQWVAWLLFTLLMVGLSVDVAAKSIVVSDPDWAGTEPVNISHGPQDLALHPVVVAGADRQLAVAWGDKWLGDQEYNIYAARSSDNGRTWSAPAAVSPTVDISESPSALIVGDQVFVAWTEKQRVGEYLRHFTLWEAEIASGEGRSIPLPESDSPSQSPIQSSLAATSNRLHIAFNAGKVKTHIWYATRPLAETTWPTATRIYTSTIGGSFFPALAVNKEGTKDELHVVWEEFHSSTERTVMHISGTVSGEGVTWASPITLSTQVTLSVQPDIATDSNGNVHAVWGEVDAGRSYVRYTYYDASSHSWALPATRIDPEPVEVNEVDPTDTAPRLALVEGDGEVRICVAWHGFREGGSAEDVLLKCSEDGGQSWASTYNMSRSPSGVPEEIDIAIWPCIAFDSTGVLSGVWQQRVDTAGGSHYEIYHSFALEQVFLPLVVRNH